MTKISNIRMRVLLLLFFRNNCDIRKYLNTNTFGSHYNILICTVSKSVPVYVFIYFSVCMSPPPQKHNLLTMWTDTSGERTDS